MVVSILVARIDIVENGRFWDESQGNQVVKCSDKFKYYYFFRVVKELSDEHNKYELGNGLLSNFDTDLLDALEASKINLKLTIVGSCDQMWEEEIVGNLASKELTEKTKAWE